MRLADRLVGCCSGTRAWRRAALVILVSCSRSASSPSTTHAMEIGEVARVGARGVPASLVAAVAHAQGVATRAAVDELIEDALLAEGAPSFRVTGDPAVQFACAAALARSVVLHLAAVAKEQGPPTDNELGMVQVAHALVPRSGPATDRARIAMAMAIRQAVSGSTSADDFKRRTEAVPPAGMLLKIEMVPPFGADGKTSDGGEIDPSFVAAAFALSYAQAISPVVETPFGWHVLRLVEHTIPDSQGLEERRRDLSDAVASMRARRALDTLLRERREKTDVSVAAAADSLTALTAVVPASQP
jgi:hypothetical protein